MHRVTGKCGKCLDSSLALWRIRPGVNLDMPEGKRALSSCRVQELDRAAVPNEIKLKLE